MTWGKFERFALEGPDREWISMLFWPQFIAEMAFLIAAPIRDWSCRKRAASGAKKAMEARPQ